MATKKYGSTRKKRSRKKQEDKVGRRNSEGRRRIQDATNQMAREQVLETEEKTESSSVKAVELLPFFPKLEENSQKE